MRDHPLQICLYHGHESFLVFLYFFELVLLHQVAYSFSADGDQICFDFHNTAFEDRLHSISVREHDISIENALPPVFGNW